MVGLEPVSLQQCAERFRRRLASFPVEGPWQERAYWDPVPTAREYTDTMGTGRWEDRSWLNVPGPFYAGVTDDGLNGPFYLPEHVLSSDQCYEFVHRQPVNPREVVALVEMANYEPFGGYAWDGDRHWTPEGVRQWWSGRDAVKRWIEHERNGAQNEPYGLDSYASYLENGLEDYLRGYLFWLTERREPRVGEKLPAL